ncbi:hypothetical protein CR64_18990 [Pseudomonas aeruginosa]|nr:hypothetical protein CR64_18990 [Pseudomonas aeruginosa]
MPLAPQLVGLDRARRRPNPHQRQAGERIERAQHRGPAQPACQGPRGQHQCGEPEQSHRGVDAGQQHAEPDHRHVGGNELWQEAHVEHPDLGIEQIRQQTAQEPALVTHERRIICG